MSLTDDRCDNDVNDYRERWDATKVEQFCEYVSAIQALIAKQAWDLEPCYAKNWCSFKRSRNKVAFGIDGRAKELRLYIKLDEDEARAFGIPFIKYEPGYKQALYHIAPDKDWLTRFEPPLIRAYEHCLKRKRG